MESIEINFRLDENGRTANTTCGSSKEADRDDDNNKDDKNTGGAGLDYSSKASMTNLAFDDDSNRQQNLIDDILFDCEISDSGLMPRTFWVPCRGMKPRCTLEQFAVDVFHHHVSSDVEYDPTCSGAEWWCQIRPSPEKTGRYSMHCPNDDDDQDGTDPFEQGISMHVDKDEDLRILTGGTTYVHPHLSTVTYLTDFGSPTIIMNCRVHPFEGTWIVPSSENCEGPVEGFVSWPLRGKHTSFDGRYLHAAPCDLMEDGVFEKQIQFTPSEDDEKWNKIQKRRHRRVTVLVNIWLNYKPFDVKPFPDTMIEKMSGSIDDSKRVRLQFEANTNSSTVKNTIVTSTKVTEEDTNGDAFGDSYDPTKFVWPLGDKNSGEQLHVYIPLQTIQKEASNGGNVLIRWEESGTLKDDMNKDNLCFRIVDNKKSTTEDQIEDGEETTVEEDSNSKRLKESDNVEAEDVKRARVSHE
jgi:hypothetical protein